MGSKQFDLYRPWVQIAITAGLRSASKSVAVKSWGIADEIVQESCESRAEIQQISEGNERKDEWLKE